MVRKPDLLRAMGPRTAILLVSLKPSPKSPHANEMLCKCFLRSRRANRTKGGKAGVSCLSKHHVLDFRVLRVSEVSLTDKFTGSRWGQEQYLKWFGPRLSTRTWFQSSKMHKAVRNKYLNPWIISGGIIKTGSYPKPRGEE